MNHKRLSSVAFGMLLCASLCSTSLNAQDAGKTETTQNPSAMVKNASSSSEQLTAAEKKCSVSICFPCNGSAGSSSARR